MQAAFVQAAGDNVSVLAASIGFNDENMKKFIQTMKSLNQQYAPNTVLLPELNFARSCDTDYELSRLDEILSYNWYKSIDICGGESEQSIKNFKK